MTAYERRMSILEVLCKRRKETRENLAFEFGVCIRTIDYDVQALSLKYPIYTEPGRGGGIYVSNGFRLMQQYMTSEQTELLIKMSNTLTGEDKQTMQEIINRFGNDKGGKRK